ncbi:MAG: hypothetical protein JWR82_756 [Blastococcus sp.]|jgi:hypothetical protein|nr:hypothetical protein [Blastococcus sp.]
MSTPGNESVQQSQPDYGQPYPGQQPTQQYGAAQYGSQYGYGQPMPGVPAHAQYAQPQGPIGQVRSTGVQILLFIVTFGIWSLVYYYQTHEEMKRHSGEGVGGVLALVLAFFVGFVSPYLHSHEVGVLYQRRGQEAPVTALTGLWFFPGMLILVGPIVWFVKTNGALNEYWKSVGAR